MDRDFVGYGEHPPRVEWPGKARVALSMVVNYEEGSEYSFAFGDRLQEGYKEYPKTMPEGVRDFANESTYEYGSRVGFWRILRIFKKHEAPATFYACALALERNPAAARAITAHGHEVCCHGYRWEEVFRKSEEEERADIHKAVASLRETTGERPVGWYSRYSPSVHTRRLLMEEGGFAYDSDSYCDDLPYYVQVDGKPFLILPYTLETNDIRFWAGGGFSTADDFFAYMRDALDTLWEEGAETPKMMSVGLHMRIIGRPARARALDKFLAYARAKGGVWITRRIDIAKAWTAQHPPPG
ncbi:MAG: allantoinase PuuE [SAR324 cluster bacterium]|nr:allantoinase PuuE [SAR324 cluster bacterium]MCH8886971.1 allantoinase PuuE [SAR324 cluster bacterium]